jgi:SAM-dependent methyltransferase
MSRAEIVMEEGSTAMTARDDEARVGAGNEIFIELIRSYAPACPLSSLHVLDWGCGQGATVQALSRAGLSACGCDFADRLGSSDALRAIEPSPYHLPYEDCAFDFVISNNVLEHAQNVEESYREIRRVLKPGGRAVHLFPGKWYLPTEPHMWVPFMNWVWPCRPRWWLAVWARLGVRKDNQRGMTWREVVEDNDQYLRDHCSYRTSRYHSRMSKRVFGTYEWPMRKFIDISPGGVGRLGRHLPFRSITGAVSKQLRVAVLVQTRERDEGQRPAAAGS